MALPEFITMTAHVMGLIPLDIPNPPPAQPPGTGGVTTLLGWLKWGGLAVAAGAIVVGGGLVALSALGHGGEGRALSKLVWPFVGVVIIGGGISMISLLAGG